MLGKSKINPTVASTQTQQRENAHKKSKQRGGFFLNSKNVGQLILKSILLLVIPYAYLLLCGLVFDKWLRLYSMAPFIFYSLIALYVAAIAMIIIAIIRFVRARRRK